MSLEVNISEPDEFNCLELHSSLKEVAVVKGFEDFVYHVDCISGKSGNYIANVFRVVIKKTDNDEEGFNVIVKTLVNTERQVLFHELHQREVIAYNDVIRKFIVVQDDLSKDLRIVLPECLYSNKEKNTEVIILNDLKNQGFEIDSKQANFEYLSFEQVSAVISELAKFHALSFVMQKQVPEKFKELTTNFHDIIYQNQFLNKSKLKYYFFESFDMSLKLVRDKDAKKLLKVLKVSLLDVLQDYTKTGKTNVLCHGDCWVNNMLFKYEDSGQIKVCFIDFQAMRYANPMTDFMYFLYICTDSKFRSEHLEELKNTYYDSMKSFISLFDTNVDEVYPREEYEKDFDRFLPYGLLVALIELRIVTMTPEEDAILKGSKLASNWDLTQVPSESDLFIHRVNDLVNEAVANGVLDKLIQR